MKSFTLVCNFGCIPSRLSSVREKVIFVIYQINVYHLFLFFVLEHCLTCMVVFKQLI